MPGTSLVAKQVGQMTNSDQKVLVKIVIVIDCLTNFNQPYDFVVIKIGQVATYGYNWSFFGLAFVNPEHAQEVSASLGPARCKS